MLASTLPFRIAPDIAEFLADVVEGLSEPVKTIPPKYFYDDVGSALFEAITALPEYGLTRADERLLRRHAPAIARFVGAEARIVELGSGTGRKTRQILRAFRTPEYHAIDVSAAALEQCRRDLSAVARVQIHSGTYLDGIGQISLIRGPEPLLVLFLGSTIGNFGHDDGTAFLRSLGGLLRPGDLLLIGFDLVKDRNCLLAAYDDPVGVTAAFNLNLLARINRELGADFKLRQFAHEARYDDSKRRVEMHLRSLKEQTVTIGMAGRHFEFREDETIWTESSHKFRPADLPILAKSTGFREVAQWADTGWPFAESLWLRSEP